MIGHVLVSAAEILHHNDDNGDVVDDNDDQGQTEFVTFRDNFRIPRNDEPGRFKYFRTEFKVQKCIYLMSKN